MTLDTRSPAEIAYDATRLSPTAGIPSIAEQLAACGPTDMFNSTTILSITLPSGEQVTRVTTDAHPADWVTIRRGNVEIDVKPDGSINGVSIGDSYIDSATTEDWLTAAALVLMDRAMLGKLAALPVEVQQAIADWHALGFYEEQRIAKSVGFGEWMRRRAA